MLISDNGLRVKSETVCLTGIIIALNRLHMLAIYSARNQI